MVCRNVQEPQLIGGRLAQAGPASQVTATPAGPDAARLLGWTHLGPGTITEPGTVRAGQFTFPGVASPQLTGTVLVYYRPEDVLLVSSRRIQQAQEQTASYPGEAGQLSEQPRRRKDLEQGLDFG